MQPRAKEHQDIYEAVLNTAKYSSEGLKSISNDIKKALEVLLSPHYESNAKLQKLANVNILDPAVARQLGNTNVTPIVEKLQDIHKSLVETNKEIQQMQSRLAILQGKVLDPNVSLDVKNEFEKQTRELNELNNQYKETYRLLQKEAMVIGDPKLAAQVADNKTKQTLSTQLDGLYKKTQELKAQIQAKNKIIHKVEVDEEKQHITPRPGR